MRGRRWLSRPSQRAVPTLAPTDTSSARVDVPSTTPSRSSPRLVRTGDDPHPPASQSPLCLWVPQNLQQTRSVSRSTPRPWTQFAFSPAPALGLSRFWYPPIRQLVQLNVCHQIAHIDPCTQTARSLRQEPELILMRQDRLR